MGYIYLITNSINGKYYIGQTVNTIETRWTQHKSEAKRGIPDVYFIRALRKYGVENFTIKEIEECDNALLDEREQYYIKLYDSNNKEKGYNSTIGGNSNNRKVDREVIKKKWDEGFAIGEIAEMFSCHPNTISTALDYYKISSDERRSRGQQLNGNKRKKIILQYSLQGELIQQYSCIAEVIEKTGHSETNIRSACNNAPHKAYGYIWCHEEDKSNIQQIIANVPTKKTFRAIEQYTLDGQLIQEYDSIIAAAEALNVHRVSIESALKNKSFNCQGFLWKYKDDSTDISEKVQKNQSKKDYMKKPINQYDKMGNFIRQYDSAADAAKALNKNGGGSSITKACKGKLKTAYGFIWSYATA